MLRETFPILALIALPGLSPAQKVGKTAPEIHFQTTWNFGSVKSDRLSQLRGSAVLVEFWGTH